MLPPIDKMKSLILILIFSSKFTFGQESSFLYIVDSSKKLYQSKKSGNVLLKSTFKSSIAESYQIDTIRINYSNKNNCIRLSYGDNGFFISKSKYYVLNFLKRTYIDYSKNRSFRNEKTEGLQEFPQLNKFFFDKFYNKEFSLKLEDTVLHIFNGSDHLYIDTSTYIVTKYKNLVFDITGVQIKEWEIISQVYDDESDILLSVTNIADEFRKEKIKEKEELKPTNFIGRNLGDFVQIDELESDDGEILKKDSLERKYILFDFFYQSCMPCVKSFPELKTLYTYVDSGLLLIIGVDPILNDSLSMNKFKKRYNLKHPILIGVEAEKINKVFNQFSIYPLYLFIDQSGKIIKIIEGYSQDCLTPIKKRLEGKN